MSGSAIGLRRMLPAATACRSRVPHSRIAAAQGAAMLDAGAQHVPQGAAGVMGHGAGLPLQRVHQ